MTYHNVCIKRFHCIFRVTTKPIFKPPLKSLTNGQRTNQHLARNSTLRPDQDGSRYPSSQMYSPPRAVAAVTPNSTRIPSSVNRTPTGREVDTPHYPLYLTGDTFCCNISDIRVIFLPPATKLGQGYIFTGVCDSVHRGSLPQCMLGYHAPLSLLIY